MTYQERKYRHYIKGDNLIKFEVIEKETDLLILAETNLYNKALALVIKYRAQLENYIQKDPTFLKTLKPMFWLKWGAPKIAWDMALATRKVNVGPMASVAGAFAEYVGKDLLKDKLTKEIIIENGGDIYMKTNQTRKVGVYAGNSPFSEKIAIEINPKDSPLGICTSAGTVGHSLSFGSADAVVVSAKSTLLADAAATAIGNVVKSKETIDDGLKLAKKIHGLMGVLIIKDDRMGVVGKVKIVPV